MSEHTTQQMQFIHCPGGKSGMAKEANWSRRRLGFHLGRASAQDPPAQLQLQLPYTEGRLTVLPSLLVPRSFHFYALNRYILLIGLCNYPAASTQPD